MSGVDDAERSFRAAVMATQAPLAPDSLDGMDIASRQALIVASRAEGDEARGPKDGAAAAATKHTYARPSSPADDQMRTMQSVLQRQHEQPRPAPAPKPYANAADPPASALIVGPVPSAPAYVGAAAAERCQAPEGDGDVEALVYHGHDPSPVEVGAATLERLVFVGYQNEVVQMPWELLLLMMIAWITTATV